jgi:FixJ family two-component response regulator
MEATTVLIVNDSEADRAAMVEALRAPHIQAEVAASGEEALEKLNEQDAGVILLDADMAGETGLDVLRRLGTSRPEIPVVIVAEHGTVKSAVEAMKLGAVDVVEKPIHADQLLATVRRILNREELEERDEADYETHVELAIRAASKRRLDAAEEHVRRAIGIDSSRPEAFNLLGALLEIRGNVAEAQEHYRAALELDATYAAARENLTRTVEEEGEGPIILEEPSDKARGKRTPAPDAQTPKEEGDTPQ